MSRSRLGIKREIERRVLLHIWSKELLLIFLDMPLLGWGYSSVESTAPDASWVWSKFWSVVCFERREYSVSNCYWLGARKGFGRYGPNFDSWWLTSQRRRMSKLCLYIHQTIINDYSGLLVWQATRFWIEVWDCWRVRHKIVIAIS